VKVGFRVRVIKLSFAGSQSFGVFKAEEGSAGWNHRRGDVAEL